MVPPFQYLKSDIFFRFRSRWNALSIDRFCCDGGQLI